ncbi:26270_t:CDS:1, partial [Gigaspora rosea]
MADSILTISCLNNSTTVGFTNKDYFLIPLERACVYFDLESYRSKKITLISL